MNNKKLREIIISITNRCNLKCKMCDIPQLKKEKELTTAEITNFIKDLEELKPETIVFSGGEPFLREDIFILLEFAKEQGFRTCITSNGTLITKDIAVELKKVKTDIVNISIEGPEKVHDNLRGEGSFAKSIEALSYLKEQGIETTIATVVSKFSYKYLSFMVELAHFLKATTVKFQIFNEIFLNGPKNSSDFYLEESCFAEVKKEIIKTIAISRKYRINTNPSAYLKRIPYYLCRKKLDTMALGCSALWEVCSIDAGGNIYPCWVLTQYLLGNIMTEKISDIWDNQKHKQIREEIIGQGCRGCLMSCYDQEFKGFSFLELWLRIVSRVSLAKRENPFDIYYQKHQKKRLEIEGLKEKLSNKIQKTENNRGKNE